MLPKVAEDGQLFVCRACGKTSKDLYGGDGSYGWDASCSMNAVLVFVADLIYDVNTKRVVGIQHETISDNP